MVAGPAGVPWRAAKSTSMAFMSGGGLGIDEEGVHGIDGGGAVDADGGSPLDEIARGIAMVAPAETGAAGDDPAVAGQAKVPWRAA